MNKEIENKIILDIHDIKNLYGISRTSIDRWEKNGNFPKRIYLGIKKIGWNKKDVENWIKNKTENI
jgi:prophage regulatory protein